MHQCTLLVLFFLMLGVVPRIAHADVVISEIAWMGDTRSANNEWIELFNTGAHTVDLTDWKVSADDGSPDVTLSGTVLSGATFLLERTSDDSVQGAAANQIYTGALSNGGESLKLIDATGATQDHVDASGGWSAIGGDNTTKDTAQRTDSGWTTAAPTPGTSGLSITQSTESNSSQTTAPNITTVTQYQYEALSVEPPQDIYIRVPETISTVAGTNVLLKAEVYDARGRGVDGGYITWTLGDGTTSDGREVGHRYKHEGTYIVSVRVKEGNLFDEKMISVSVNPFSVRLSIDEEGRWLEITNSSDVMLNLSGFRLRNTSQYFIIPEGTYVQHGASVRFDTEVTKLTFLKSRGHAFLLFPDGTTAAESTAPLTHSVEVAEESENEELPVVHAGETIAPAALVEAPPKHAIVGTKISFEPTQKEEKEPVKEEIKEPTAQDQTASVHAALPQDTSDSLLHWVIGLSTLMALASAGVIAARRNRTLADEFEIIEDDD